MLAIHSKRDAASHSERTTIIAPDATTGHGARRRRRIENEVPNLDAASVDRVTADVGYAASIARGAYKNLETLRPEFTKLGTQATEALDKLRDHALGALFAHLRSSPTRSPCPIPLRSPPPICNTLSYCAQRSLSLAERCMQSGEASTMR